MIEQIKNILRRIRWRVRSAFGRDVYFRRQVRMPVVHLGGREGSGFGAWAVLPDELTPRSIVYSVGVGDDISFDVDMIRHIGVTVHAFDPTPESHAWLAQQEVPDRFRLHKYAIGATDGTARFYAHRNPDWVAHSLIKSTETTNDFVEVEVKRLPTAMSLLNHEHIDLLKLDIEGSEYEVIDDMIDAGVDVRQLLVEFHHRIDEIGAEQTRRAVKRLNEAGFRLFYTSPNGSDYAFVRT